MKKIVINTCVIFLTFQCIFAQNIKKMNRCEIEINIRNTDIMFLKDSTKNIDIAIKNVSSKTIRIPEWLCVGNIDESESEIVMEIEIWDAVTEVFSPLKGETKDNNYITFCRKFKTIEPNSELLYREDIETVKDITKIGKYRLKIWLNLKSYIKCESISTEWIEFEVS